jgi:hypothetical protein
MGKNSGVASVAASVDVGDEPGGFITYRLAGGAVYRIAAEEGAEPENISQALDELSPEGGDVWLNTSPEGQWLLLATERFDPECAGWACLAVVAGDVSAGSAVRANGEIIHPEGFSAIGSGGDLIVFPAPGDSHPIDLWAVTRSKDVWTAPVLLTGKSPYAFNHQPALSPDGSKVIFDCGDLPYGAEGTSLCEVGIDGSGFRVVLTPAGSPSGLPMTGALHQPHYDPDGSIVFEADWSGEQIWRLPVDAALPVTLGPEFNNDNSPCVLPDGRIVSLWLNRPGNDPGFHEIKVMGPDGRTYFMVVIDVDVADIGLGCGW